MCSSAGVRLLSMACPTYLCAELSGFSAHCVVAKMLLVQCAVLPACVCSLWRIRLVCALCCPASLRIRHVCTIGSSAYQACLHNRLVCISGLSAHCTRSILATTQCADMPSTSTQQICRQHMRNVHHAVKCASGRSPASPYSDSGCSTDRRRAESPASTWRRTDSPY